MENTLSSGGIFSQDLRHWKLSRESRKICKIKTLNLRNSEIESDKERKFRTMHLKFRTSQELHEEILARTLDIPWVWSWKEMVWNSYFKTWRKMGSCRWEHDAQLQWEFQLSIFGAVACWCEKFGLKSDETSDRLTKTENELTLKEVRLQEVNSLVQTPWNHEPASACKLRESIQDIETLEKEIQFTRVSENTTFFHWVLVGLCSKTVADVDDGFGDRTPSYREHRHCADSKSRIYAAIAEQTVIGPDLQGHF